MLTSLLLIVAAVGQLPGESEYLAGANAQRAGQWAAAVSSFEAAAAADPALKPYAELRIAQSQARTGNVAGAEARYRAVLRLPEGPWTAIAQVRLAEAMLAAQQYAEAVKLKDSFIQLPVEPWWLADIGKANGDAMLRVPERRKDGLAYFRNVALNNIYPKERTAAAKKLLASGDAQDLGAAALGFFRSASPKEAANVLNVIAAAQRTSGGGGGAARSYTEFLNVTEAGIENIFEKAARANPEDLWLRAWIIHAARTHGDAKRFGVAKQAAMAVANVWPKERDTGDTLNWLAKKVEDGEGFEAAVPLYYKMAEACPEHHHADDGLLHVGDVYAAKGNKAEALKAYNYLGENLKEAKLQDLGFYKGALLEQQTGNAAGAAAQFAKAASLAPGRFYAHRALEKLGRDGGENLKVDGVNAFLQPATGMRGTPPALSPLVANAPQFQRLRFFGKHGLEEGEWEALDLLEKLEKDPAHEAIYQAVAETGFAHTALQFALAHGWGMEKGQKSVALRRLELPRAYWPEVTQLSKETGVDPYLILAIAKQESTFRATVESHAGASGVMQLMPKTAAWLQDKDPDIPAGTASNLKSPINSIRLGANYLQQMIERSNGNLIYAVASYNGGPGNVDKWRKQYSTQDLDAWIESIPFSETQDYVRKVLGYYMGYHSLYPVVGR